MTNITDLLDRIHQLDQNATPGPWDHTVDWAEIGSGPDSVIHGYGYADCEVCEEEIDVDARVALSPEDAEFIAEARTALPRLAAALKAVLGPHDPRDHRPLDGMFIGGQVCNSCRRPYPCPTVQAITTALEADDE